MICDRCGMQNIKHAEVCANCGAKMPEEIKCGGFADVLSFEKIDSAVIGAAAVKDTNEGYDEKIMKSLLKKTDNVIAQNERNARIGVVAAVIGIVVLICSVAFGLITLNAVNEAKKELVSVQKSLEKTSKLLENNGEVNPEDENQAAANQEGNESEKKEPPEKSKNPLDSILGN